MCCVWELTGETQAKGTPAKRTRRGPWASRGQLMEGGCAYVSSLGAALCSSSFPFVFEGCGSVAALSRRRRRRGARHDVRGFRTATNGRPRTPNSL